MFSFYARNECRTIVAIGVMLAATLFFIGAWPWALLVIALAVLILAFFRDPDRLIPTHRSVMVCPADGRISSIHEVPEFGPFDNQPALCIRIFIGLTNVHVNRAATHAMVASVEHRPGQFLSGLNPQSPEVNEAVTMVLLHPIKREPIAALRQIAGTVARTIVCAAKPGDVLQRGQRYGMIKLGSSVELYVPLRLLPNPAVELGQRVYAGTTIIVTLTGGWGRGEDPEPGAAAVHPGGDDPQTAAEAEGEEPVEVAVEEAAEPDADQPATTAESRP